jgi:hypothetical protein
MAIKLRRGPRVGQRNAELPSAARLLVDVIQCMRRHGLLHFESAT